MDAVENRHGIRVPPTPGIGSHDDLDEPGDGKADGQLPVKARRPGVTCRQISDD